MIQESHRCRDLRTASDRALMRGQERLPMEVGRDLQDKKRREGEAHFGSDTLSREC